MYVCMCERVCAQVKKRRRVKEMQNFVAENEKGEGDLNDLLLDICESIALNNDDAFFISECLLIDTRSLERRERA